MFEVLFLGTSSFVPTKTRASVSTVIRTGSSTFFVDCGEGFLKQWLSAPITLKRFPTFFFSHEHADHLLGFPAFVYSLTVASRHEQLSVHAGPKAQEKLRRLVSVLDLDDRPTILWLAAAEGIVYEDEAVTCTAFRTRHTEESLGFVFQEKARRLFLADRAEALAIPAGPWRRRLARGESVTLPDGRLVSPDDVLGPPRSGTKLAYVSDTAYTEEFLPFIENADCLVIEATYLHAEQELAKQRRHLTTREAAQIGRLARARRLILNHVSQRHEEFDILAEAQRVYRSVEIARDLWKTRVFPAN